MQTHLFESPERRSELGQFFTAVWAAEVLIERHFPDLDRDDLVLEPSCGAGAFLQALDPAIPAIGVEIDPDFAAEARRRTGREVLTGDFCNVALAARPTVILGNPPWKLALIDRFLERAHALLPDGGRIGWVVPAYTFQTASRVCRYAERWSISQESIPRNIFPGLSKPAMFAVFRKDRGRTMVGFALYHQAREIELMPKAYAGELFNGHGSVWASAVARALHALGGEADLQSLYAEIGPRRPTATQWWKEKVRQVCQRSFTRTAPGRYALTGAAAA